MREHDNGRGRLEPKPKTQRNVALDKQAYVSRDLSAPPEQRPHGGSVNEPDTHPPNEATNTTQDVATKRSQEEKRRVRRGRFLTQEELDAITHEQEQQIEATRARMAEYETLLLALREKRKDRGGRLYPDTPFVEKTREGARRYYRKHREHILQRQRERRQQKALDKQCSKGGQIFPPTSKP